MPHSLRFSIGGPSEFPEGHIIPKKAGTIDIIVVRRLGKLHCFRDECPHQPVKLSEFGELKNGKLMCHAHAGLFDIEDQGRVLGGPPQNPLCSFKCLEDQNQVWVELK